MLLETIKKKVFKKLIIPAKFMHKIGLTPNLSTFFSLIALLICFYFILNKQVLTAGLFVILSFFFDFFDGLIARATNNVTKKGDFLDKTLDTGREFTWIIFAFAGYIPFQLAGLCTALTILAHHMVILIRSNNLNNFNYLPCLFSLFPLLFFIHKFVLLAKITIFCQIFFIILNIIIVIALNKK